MITCGVDIGSATIKTVVVENNKVIASRVVPSGASPAKRASETMRALFNSVGILRDKVTRIHATGYGRNYFKEADAASSEILCHARGAAYEFASVRTVIDIGGQDLKVISIDTSGRVKNFVMNDRCAAGTGKFIEMVSSMLDMPLADMGAAALGGTDACEISSICAVFAESEIVGLTQSGKPVDVILRGVFRSVARRVMAMAGRVEIVPDVVFTGGVALNAGIAEALRRETGVEIVLHPEPQITGALGAALIAASESKRISRAIDII